jgi:hypothetical protein
MCWPHLWVRGLSQGGPVGHCRYPADLVLLHIGLSLRQGARHIATCLVAPDPAREGSDAATCYMALDPTSLLGRDPALPCVPRFWTLPLCSRGLRRCHVPRGFGPYLPAWESSDAATCPADLNGPRISGTKKGLAGLGMQLGTRVSKARLRITEVPARQVARRRHHDPQTVQIGATVPCYSATPTQLTTPGYGCSGDVTQQSDTTLMSVFSTAVRQDGRLRAADAAQDVISYS